MSQFSYPAAAAPLHARRALVFAGLFAIAAAAAIALVLVMDSPGNTQGADSNAAQAQPSLRSGGGPEESGVAATVASRAGSGPDESSVAASVAASAPHGGMDPSGMPSDRPDESRVAASISGR
jgi:hypothetical protein